MTKLNLPPYPAPDFTPEEAGEPFPPKRPSLDLFRPASRSATRGRYEPN